MNANIVIELLTHSITSNQKSAAYWANQAKQANDPQLKAKAIGLSNQWTLWAEQDKTQLALYQDTGILAA